MQITEAQRIVLKTFILADGTLGPKATSGDYQGVADGLNALASPTFTVWKTSVTINQIGKSFNASELAGLTSLNNTRLQTLAQYLAGGVDPSIASNRAFFDDVFSGAGGASTRAALLALWKRLASVAEKVLATGTGSDASPAIVGAEGVVGTLEIGRIIS